MKISKATDRKIAELRRLAAQPPPKTHQQFMAEMASLFRHALDPGSGTTPEEIRASWEAKQRACAF